MPVIIDQVFKDTVVYINESTMLPTTVTVWEGEWEVKFSVNSQGKLFLISKENLWGKRSLFIDKNIFSKITRKGGQAVKIANKKVKNQTSRGEIINIVA